MMREKTPLLDEFVCFQIGIKDFWLEVFYYFSNKNYLFHKIYATSEEPFLTMFYTINSSPLLVIK